MLDAAAQLGRLPSGGCRAPQLSRVGCRVSPDDFARVGGALAANEPRRGHGLVLGRGAGARKAQPTPCADGGPRLDGLLSEIRRASTQTDSECRSLGNLLRPSRARVSPCQSPGPANLARWRPSPHSASCFVPALLGVQCRNRSNTLADIFAPRATTGRRGQIGCRGRLRGCGAPRAVVARGGGALPRSRQDNVWAGKHCAPKLVGCLGCDDQRAEGSAPGLQRDDIAHARAGGRVDSWLRPHGALPRDTLGGEGELRPRAPGAAQVRWCERRLKNSSPFALV